MKAFIGNLQSTLVGAILDVLARSVMFAAVKAKDVLRMGMVGALRPRACALLASILLLPHTSLAAIDNTDCGISESRGIDAAREVTPVPWAIAGFAAAGLTCFCLGTALYEENGYPDPLLSVVTLSAGILIVYFAVSQGRRRLGKLPESDTDGVPVVGCFEEAFVRTVQRRNLAALGIGATLASVAAAPLFVVYGVLQLLPVASPE